MATSTPLIESTAHTMRKLDQPLDLLFVPGILPRTDGQPKKADAGRLLAAEAVPTPGSLPYQITRAYDLTVSKALDANIPVIGGGAVGAQRRVIILERVGYSERPTPDGGKEQVGFAIRLCITVNKLDAHVKLSLPFITASAQLGTTEAVWTLQIVGLTGPKIAAVDIVPTELNVETFVVAKQSLQKLIEALADASTVLDPQVIARLVPATSLDDRYLPLVAQIAALGAISRGWTMQDAASRYHWDPAQAPSTFATAYQDVAGITNLTDRPTKEAVGIAAKLLGTVGVGPR